EVAGTVAALGDGVDGWQVGDRVTTETYFHVCGRCLHCRRGRPNLCRERRSIGSKQDGTFARYLATPAHNLHRVPDRLPLEAGALTEPLACVVHGVNDTAGVRAGDDVVVAGPGPIGLLAIQVALANGARVVATGTDDDRDRLALARELGAHGTVNVQASDDPDAEIAELLDGGADVAIECSGAGPAIPTLLRAVRPGGRYAQVGLFGRPVPVDQDVICLKELVVTGSNATIPTAWPRALRLLERGAIDVERTITHRFAVTDWERALATVRAKEGVKVVLAPSA
ncbi:MAG: zinc-binding dehydrogenase, partial [Trueperaceae bacterium]